MFTLFTLDVVQLENSLPETLDVIIHVFALEALNSRQLIFSQHGDTEDLIGLMYEACCKIQ